MHILVDKKMPGKAKEILCRYGNVIEFYSQHIVYEAISGHPDIFFCQTPETLIAAPNTPQHILGMLSEHNIDYTTGHNPLESAYPRTAFYNAVVHNDMLIHNLSITDSSITTQASIKIKINVNQGYTRCNLMGLPDNSFITSDKGIETTLKKENFNTLFINPGNIKLTGFAHGFLGGACGIAKDKFFICGSLKYLHNPGVLKLFIEKSGLEVVELYDGQVMDVGSILFVT